MVAINTATTTNNAPDCVEIWAEATRRCSPATQMSPIYDGDFTVQ